MKKIAQNAIGTVVDWINELVAKIRGAAAALANLKNGVGAAQDAYNAAYNGYMDNYNKRKNAKQWDSSHKDLEWDDDNGWVPKGTSSSGNGSSRAGSQTAANPYPAITSGAKKASKATKPVSYTHLVTKLKADMKAQAEGFAFDNALDAAILGKKGRSVKAVRALLDLDALKGSADRSTDIAKALDDAAKANPWAFGEDGAAGVAVVSTGAEHGAPPANDSDGVEAAFKSLNPELNL